MLLCINLKQKVRKFVFGGLFLCGNNVFWYPQVLTIRCLILQLVAIPYLHSLGPNSILKDDNARPHRAGFIRDSLQNVGVERMEWPASSPDLNPIEHL